MPTIKNAVPSTNAITIPTIVTVSEKESPSPRSGITKAPMSVSIATTIAKLDAPFRNLCLRNKDSKDVFGC